MRSILISAGIALVMSGAAAQSVKRSYNDSVVIAPLYVEYATVSDQKFASEAIELRRRIGEAPHVLLGFAAFLNLDYSETPLLDRPIDERMLASTLQEADLIVRRAHANGLVTHISISSGFFHGWNRLREAAIRDDVRNAQWFADGSIAPPADLKSLTEIPHSVWMTPSRYALPLHERMEETVRLVARHLGGLIAAFPETLVSVSGDGEVELTWERNFSAGATNASADAGILYADYSPFAVAEFRDSLRNPAYSGDFSPDTDDNGDGHTFNRDFGQHFTAWRLKYFEESGPIPFRKYMALPEKLPSSGPYFAADGFDAPRIAKPGDRFWEAWQHFRQQMIASYVSDFARWVSIPPTQFYSHQIPADFLFEQPRNKRLETSASPLKTAFVGPFGSAGVTAYDLFDGKRHLRTATASLFSHIVAQSPNWGVLEYNPSVPSQLTIRPTNDEGYYLEQLRMLHSFLPHVIVPFAWTNLPDHPLETIKDRPFERALAKFVQEVGKTPWSLPK